MHISDNEINIIKKNKSEFVSFKYLSNDGSLNQIDASLKSIQENGFAIYDDKINLVPIEGKSFIDPFRSFPTTSFLCNNNIEESDSRSRAKEMFSIPDKETSINFSVEMSFWLKGFASDFDSNQISYNLVDKYANFRSDIISTLERINISTTIHRMGESAGESIIGIKGRDIIDLVDNIILARFVISNVAHSYNLQIEFVTENNLSNILLLINGEKTIIDNLFEGMKLLENAKVNKLEVKSVNRYIANHLNKDSIKANMFCNNFITPYLDFAGSLMYKF